MARTKNNKTASKRGQTSMANVTSSDSTSSFPNSSSSSMPPEWATRYVRESAERYRSVLRAAQQQQQTSFSGRPTYGPAPPPPSVEDLSSSMDFMAMAQDACTDTEMNALMGMFAEMMGVQEGNLDAHSSGNSSAATFGAAIMTDQDCLQGFGFRSTGSGSSVPNGWPPQMQDTWRSSQDEDGDYDNDERFIDIIEGGEGVASGRLSPSQWTRLEEVVDEDMREGEEKAKRAAKRREKKLRRKEKLKQEAAAKTAEASQKKQERAIQSWRSRIVSACQAGEAGKVGALLSESPLGRSDNENGIDLLKEMEFLVPHCIAKSRELVETGREARIKLTDYVHSMTPSVLFTIGRSGRNTLHSACYTGDAHLVKRILEYSGIGNAVACPPNEFYDLLQCHESGWTALHYAAAFGSTQIVEKLLAAPCFAECRTDKTLTCRSSDGEGITARELVEALLSPETLDASLTTSGRCLDEAKQQTLGRSREHKKHMQILQTIADRLGGIEANGYTWPSTSRGNEVYEEPNEELRSSTEKTSKKKQKKKKKTPKGLERKTSVATKASVESPVEVEDPVVTALLGMGFTKDQVDDAVRACGGTAHATADDMVVWILGGEGAVGTASTEVISSDTDHAGDNDSSWGQEAKLNDSASLKNRSESASSQEVQDQLAAEKLAAKREEQRRRNREWNNREQARQREEARAKLAKAVELRARADAVRLGASNPEVVSATHPDGTAYKGSPFLAGDQGDVVPTPVPCIDTQKSVPDALQRQAEAPRMFAAVEQSHPGDTHEFSYSEYSAPGNIHVASELAFAPTIPPPGYGPVLPVTYPGTGDVETSTQTLGEIRATAKEFVPSAFGVLPPAQRSLIGGNQPSLIGRSGSLSISDHGTETPVRRAHSHSFCHQPTTVTPASPEPSAMSSMTGISTLDEVPPIPPAIGFAFNEQVKTGFSPASGQGPPAPDEPGIWGSGTAPPSKPTVSGISLGLLQDSMMAQQKSEPFSFSGQSGATERTSTSSMWGSDGVTNEFSTGAGFSSIW